MDESGRGRARGLSVADDVFAGGGEMGALARAHDWGATPIGPVEEWPQSLRTAVGMLLNSRYPMFIFWGPHLVKIYNDGYRPILGMTKHPWALGRPGPDVWPEIWDTIGPMVVTVTERGEATWSDDLPLFMHRNGYLEEVYFTFSYSPVRDEGGGVGGLFCACTETTATVLGERRLRTLRDLAARAAEARTVDDAGRGAVEILASAVADVPFALLYLLDDEGHRGVLVAAAGVDAGAPFAPTTIVLAAEPADQVAWPVARVAESGSAILLDDLVRRFNALPPGPYPEPPSSALLLPLTRASQTRPAGVLIAGISARRALDEAYRTFLELVAGQVATGIGNARAYEEERRRAEALAELDRAKTAFFSNVSHEFRTPLTLLLGPLEDVLAQPDVLTDDDRARLVLAHRNGLRLLRLVNTLLDFSRIEASRAAPAYELIDLATLTSDLASAFRSAVERAGLRLLVDCSAVQEPVPADRDMWEKIVLNLLSNAFKFTFTGEIAVVLRPGPAGRTVELIVRDTGVGIPAAELPRVFERFHRVDGQPSRTHEGTGIGLSLVQELVRLHGGTISVQSQVGEGSTFTVTIPTTVTRPLLTPASPPPATTALGAAPYLEEALRWLPDPPLAGAPVPTDGGRVLLADDNADMRAYLVRLLGARWTVEAVTDGAAALAAAHERRPDVILADVMMPGLDGYALLRAVRASQQLRDLPVILVSARAGDEAQLDGLEAGADDYVVKPFSARQLVARIEAQVRLAHLRAQARGATEAALRTSEAHFRELADTTPVMLWMTDPHGHCTYLNRRWAEFTGMAPSAGLGSGWLTTVHPEDADEASRVFMAANDSRAPFSLEYRLRRHDGAYRWAIDTGQPRFDDHGHYLGFVGAVIDIHERWQAEERLSRSEERFRQVADLLPQFIWVSRANQQLEYVNQRWTNYTGLDLDATSDPAQLVAVIHPDDRAELFRRWEQAVASGTALEAEARLRGADGNHRWFLIQSIPLRDDTGHVIRWFGTSTNIDERKQAEADVRLLAELGERVRLADDADALLYDVARAVGDHLDVRRSFFIEIDLANDHGLVRRDYCRGVESVAGAYHVSEYSDSALVEIVAGHTIVNHDSRIDPRTAGDYARTYGPRGERAYIAVPLMRHRRWDGTFWVSTDVPRRWQPREVALVETMAERTWLAVEKLRLDAELRNSLAAERAAREEAEAAVRARDAFLSIAAHELRTPVTGLKGAAQLLLRRLAAGQVEPERLARTLRAFGESADRLALLTDDLLDIARIRTGSLALRLRPTDLVKLVRAAVARASEQAGVAHRLTTGAPEQLDLVLIDEGRIDQVLTNLLDNAIKYSPVGGEVTISVEATAGRVTISVRDTGIGLPPGASAMIFEPFGRAANAAASHLPGMGLGLHICRTIVERHGGAIWADSAGEGQGTTVTFWLPTTAAPETPAPSR